MSNNNEYKRESEQLQLFLGEMGDYLARHSGFVQRESELSGSGLVQILTLGSLENGKSSLVDFSRVAAELGIEITAAGLHQRLGKSAVALLAEVCHLYMAQHSSTHLQTVLGAFPAVHVIDSSTITLPPSLATDFRGSRQQASIKIQLAYEYRSGKIEALHLQAGCEPDQKCCLPQVVAQADDLVLFDLGYFDQQRFADLNQADIYFVSRVGSQVGLYESQLSAGGVDLLSYIAKGSTSGEFRLHLGSRARVAVRVFYYRLAASVINERRRKAKKAAQSRGQTSSERSLAWLEWSFFISNAPAALLNSEQVAVIYRVRWQIELIFKVWKGEMDLDYMGKWRVERILAQFYGRLLALLHFHALIEKYQGQADWEISLKKAYTVFKRSASRLMGIVRANFWGILSFLKDFDRAIRRFATKSKRRKNPSTLAHLELVHA